MKQRHFRQVDVFTATPYLGNPLAVVLDGEGLSTDEMQRFARWTNLSETAFLLPPVRRGAHYQARIFTPGGELPFAGHPTLGSCHAWLEAGGTAGDTVVQECAVGLVRIRRAGTRLAFAAPPVKCTPPNPQQLAEVLAALGLQPTQLTGAQLLDNGPAWLTLLVDQRATLLALEPDHGRLKEIGIKVGVAHVRCTRDAPSVDPPVTVRAFAACAGIAEDPVTGSLNASLAQWLISDDRAPPRYLATQGERLGRAGQVHIERDDVGQVWVGGESVTCVAGTVVL